MWPACKGRCASIPMFMATAVLSLRIRASVPCTRCCMRDRSCSTTFTGIIRVGLFRCFYYEFLMDIPRPEKWEMDVWVTFSNPPVGMDSLVTWVQATGLQPDDLARYEQHQRRIRVIVVERLRPLLLARKDDVLLPMLEKL